MAFKIIWSETAIEDLQHVTEYLINEWSLNSALKFRVKLSKKVGIISELPHIGKRSAKNPQVQMFGITKQSSIYYRFVNDEVTILSIFDNRQNPVKQP